MSDGVKPVPDVAFRFRSDWPTNLVAGPTDRNGSAAWNLVDHRSSADGCRLIRNLTKDSEAECRVDWLKGPAQVAV